MPSQKSQKIDLNAEYPCPCRRRGCLQLITLTEAFGCNRCQQIFVIEENGYVIEQLSTSYPYKRSWRWSGYRWVSARSSGIGKLYLPLSLGVVILLLISGLPAALGSGSGKVLFLILFCLALALLPAVMVWLAYRR